jgi:hypothetical protein
MKKSYLLILLLTLQSITVNCQNKWESEEMSSFLFCYDMLFMDEKYYYLNDTPLSFFPKYKSIYGEDTLLRCIFDRDNTLFRDRRQHFAFWFIRDSLLFLCDIWACGHYYKSTLPNQYIEIERLTKRQFDKSTDSIPTVMLSIKTGSEYVQVPFKCVICRNGILLDDWMTGYLFLKDYTTLLEEWLTTPFLR